MPSKLKRVSENTEAVVAAIAEREGRTFVAQLDRLVGAGLRAEGYAEAPEAPTATPTQALQATG